MVGAEPDRQTQHAFGAERLDVVQRLKDIGTEPWFLRKADKNRGYLRLQPRDCKAMRSACACTVHAFGPATPL